VNYKHSNLPAGSKFCKLYSVIEYAQANEQTLLECKFKVRAGSINSLSTKFAHEAFKFQFILLSASVGSLIENTCSSERRYKIKESSLPLFEYFIHNQGLLLYACYFFVDARSFTHKQETRFLLSPIKRAHIHTTHTQALISLTSILISKSLLCFTLRRQKVGSTRGRRS